MEMKKRIISSICSLLVLCSMLFVAAVDVNAETSELKEVDGSYLTFDEESKGSTADNDLLRGVHLMDGDSIISKAGKGKIYVYGETSANHTVDYVAVIVYVDRYHEDTGRWGQVDYMIEEQTDNYYAVTAKTLKVEGGYYYRVHSDHIAGNKDEKPYDTAISYTDGIWIE